MKAPSVALLVMLGLYALGIGGCGSHSGSSQDVTVQLDVTASGPVVEWSGWISWGNVVSVSGTTPSTTPLFTVCLKDLDYGNRDCQTNSGVVHVSVDS